MVIRNARVFAESGHFEPKEIHIAGRYFTDLETDGEILDADGLYAIPGLVDIHTHGCMGYEYTTATVEQIGLMTDYQAQNGITVICPTTMTLPEQQLAKACARIAGFHPGSGAALGGIHMEGPFLNRDKLGAQNPDYVHLPDIGMFLRLQEAARQSIKLLALSPELPGAVDFIGGVCKDVHISLAHTLADYQTAMQAFSHGASHVTHMFNAMSRFSHRDPGVVGAALDTPGATVELICDGIHIHPTMVRSVFTLFGDNRVVMVSDSMMAAGLGDGNYELGGLEVSVLGKRASLTHGDSLAGSVSNLMDCLRVAVTEIGIPLESAVKAAAINPARAIGIDHLHGSIAAGKYADMVLLDPALDIKHVIVRGRHLK